MDAQIGFADGLRRVFPTMVASYLPFRGWIRRETLSDQMLLTFLSEATGRRHRNRRRRCRRIFVVESLPGRRVSAALESLDHAGAHQL